MVRPLTTPLVIVLRITCCTWKKQGRRSGCALSMLLRDRGAKQQQAAGVSPFFPFKEEGGAGSSSRVRMAAKVKGKGDTEVGAYVYMYVWRVCGGPSRIPALPAS